MRRANIYLACLLVLMAALHRRGIDDDRRPSIREPSREWEVLLGKKKTVEARPELMSGDSPEVG